MKVTARALATLAVIWLHAVVVLSARKRFKACITPTGTDGYCKALRNCTEVLNIPQTETRLVLSSLVQTLERYHCGWSGRHPRVCCPRHGAVRPAAAPESGPTAAQRPWAPRLEHCRNGVAGVTPCVAVFVSYIHLLTSSHCIYGDAAHPGNTTYLRISRSNQSDKSCASPSEQMAIEQIVVNPDYRQDISLIKLKAPVSITGVFQPISLPIADISDQQTSGLLAGVLQHDAMAWESVKEVDRGTCQARHQTTGTAIALGALHVCASTTVCHVAAGGPLVRLGERGWELHGLYSFGPDSCELDAESKKKSQKTDVVVAPNVYTKVFAYVQWIRMNMATV